MRWLIILPQGTVSEGVVNVTRTIILDARRKRADCMSATAQMTTDEVSLFCGTVDREVGIVERRSWDESVGVVESVGIVERRSWDESFSYRPTGLKIEKQL